MFFVQVKVDKSFTIYGTRPVKLMPFFDLQLIFLIDTSKDWC